MTVAVNQPQDKSGDDFEKVATAINLALKFYDIKMSKDQKKAIDEMKKQDAEKKAKDEAVDFQAKYEPVKERPNFGPFIPVDQVPSLAKQNLPEGSVGVVPTAFGQKEREIKVQEGNLNYQRGMQREAIAKEDREKVSKYAADFSNDKEIVNIKEKVNAANFIDDLLQQENPQMDAVALRQVFRLSGDVGAIRPEDLEQLGASPALKDRAVLALKMMMNGERIDDKSRVAIGKMADIIRHNSKGDVGRIAERYAKRGAKELRSFNMNDMLEALDADSILPKRSQGQTQMTQKDGLQKNPAQPNTGSGTAHGNSNFDPDRFLRGR